MKVGIVVPYSWSFWGAVVEHAELQAEALRRHGVDTRTIIGNDPPGSFTRVLHPRSGRHDTPPPDIIPVGRSVIVPANGTLPNIVLSPRAIGRVSRALESEHFDVLHLHEPMTPAICVAALALAKVPVVATFHAHGKLGWMRPAMPVWGFLIDRLDHRIAVSPHARDTANRWLPGEYEISPERRADSSGGRPARARAPDSLRRAAGGTQRVARACSVPGPRSVDARGARLRIVGADPLAVRLLLTRERVSDEGIDILGFLSQEELTAELLRAKALVAPSLGGESFGMVLTRAYACATPVVASDIDGYREVMTKEAAVSFPAGDKGALTDAVVNLLEDEPRRAALGEGARRLAVERYSWDDIGRRLVEIYEQAVAAP